MEQSNPICQIMELSVVALRVESMSLMFQAKILSILAIYLFVKGSLLKETKNEQSVSVPFSSTVDPNS